MNRCRLCNKPIWAEYTDRILFCSECRKAVEEEIWYNRPITAEDIESCIDVLKLKDEVIFLRDLLNVKRIELKYLIEQNGRLQRTNKNLKDKLSKLEVLVSKA